MCCHKHPDNGSDLAVANAEEADLRAELVTARNRLWEAEKYVLRSEIAPNDFDALRRILKGAD